MASVIADILDRLDKRLSAIENNIAIKKNPLEKAFGLSAADMIKIAFYSVGIVIFAVRSDARISNLEKITEKLVDSQTQTAAFIESSDAWHSATNATQFYRGKPINPGYQFPNFTGRPIKQENRKEGDNEVNELGS